MSLSWNRLSFSWNRLTFSWNRLTLSGNRLSLSWNRLSFSWNRLSIITRSSHLKQPELSGRSTDWYAIPGSSVLRPNNAAPRRHEGTRRQGSHGKGALRPATRGCHKNLTPVLRPDNAAPHFSELLGVFSWIPPNKTTPVAMNVLPEINLI